MYIQNKNNSIRLNFINDKWFALNAGAVAVAASGAAVWNGWIRNPKGQIVFTDSSTESVCIYLLSIVSHFPHGPTYKLPSFCFAQMAKYDVDGIALVLFNFIWILHYIIYSTHIFFARLLFSILVVRARDFLLFFSFNVWQYQSFDFLSIYVGNAKTLQNFPIVWSDDVMNWSTRCSVVSTHIECVRNITADSHEWVE